MFEMECDDVDGESTNSTVRVITPRVPKPKLITPRAPNRVIAPTVITPTVIQPMEDSLIEMGSPIAHILGETVGLFQGYRPYSNLLTFCQCYHIEN